MFNDPSYKVSLGFALALHLTLILLLVIKITHAGHNMVLVASNNIIQATAINEHDFDLQMSKKIVSQVSAPKPMETPPEPMKKPEVAKEPVTNQLQTLLKKSLQAEQAQELRELKTARKKYQKDLAKQQEQKLQQMLQDQVNAEQQQLADSQAEAHGMRVRGEVNRHGALIKQAIQGEWTMPDGKPGDFCRVLISIAPGGVVLEVKLLESSGNPALNRSAQAAIFKASPLPVPEEQFLFDEFREIRFTFRPEGVVEN